jgi:amidase
MASPAPISIPALASLATGADLPALSAPVTLSQGGLPLGVQVMRRWGRI